MAEHTIPTIDLTPLRTGTDADKRKVARQIDEAERQRISLQMGKDLSALH